MECSGSVQRNASIEMRQMILMTVAQIPYGKIASYGQIAAMSGLPKHARLVGRVLNELASESDIPWHRVVNAQGRISLNRLDEFGFNRQQAKLLEEGITFNNGKINFKVFGWFEP